MTLDKVALFLDEKCLLTVNTKILPGTVTTIMGPSGSGKSSLLAFIAGFLSPAFTAKGRVLIGNDDITRLKPERRRAGILFQDALLFPHMSVGQNLCFAMSRTVSRTITSSRGERIEIVKRILNEAGLKGMFDRDPDTLSGGQQARVALLRVIVSRPRALLLDEPFSRLDRALRQQIRQFVFDEAKKHDLPVLLVTHDEEDAQAAAGPIIELTGPGRAQ